MASIAEFTARLGFGLAAAAVVMMAGCGAPGPSAPESLAVSRAPVASEAAPASPSAAPTPSSTPAPTPLLALPQPGRPYDAAAVLEAMRTSRRPGGVPDEVETPPIAAAIAERIWTFDGSPWPSLTAGGSCGPDRCTIELAGTPAGALGEDLYVFSVLPATGKVEVLDASLRGLPTALLPELDEAARAVTVEDLGDLVLGSARWLPPPDEGTFLLAYRSGGEEGAPAVDVLLDVDEGTAAPLN